MKSKFMKNYGSYIGVITGMLTMRFILEGEIEHWQYMIVPIGVGFLINMLIVKFIERKGKKRNEEDTDGLDNTL